MPKAGRDIGQALAWHESQRTGLGGRFYVALPDAEADIRGEPGLGREIEPRIHKWNLRRFPYAVVSRVEAQVMAVNAIMQWHREPGAWKRD